MKIFIDADGCPVVKLTIKIAKEYNIPVVVVKNFNHVIEDNYATVISVDNARDSADFYIVNHVQDNDIIITQDYGLAAMALSKSARVINQNGKLVDSSNISIILEGRHFNQELRKKQKKYGSKFKKRTIKNDEIFDVSLRQLLNQNH